MNPIPKIIEIVARDTSPPLYNITEYLWFQVFGSSEVAIRSLSFLYYCLTVFFVFKIGSFLWSRKTGLLAAVLTFFNPFFFIYAFEGRMYSILALGVTASMYFFLKRNWVGYVLATVWTLYSHHFGIFALFVQGFWFLKEFFVGKRATAVSMLKAFFAVGILYSPWLIPLYNQTKMVGGGFWLGTPSPEDLLKLVYEYLAGGLPHDLALLAFCFVLITLLLRKWTKSIEKTLFLLSWFLGPIFLAWLISQKFQSIFYNRYLLYAIPGAMLIVSSKARKYSGISLGILIILFAIIDFNYFTHPTKRPFREMAEYVKQTKKQGDILINWNSSSHHLWESKYYQIPAPLYIPKGDLPFYVGTAQMTDDDILRQIPEKITRVGVITSGSVDEIVLPNYTEKEVVVFADLKFVWFSKK